jgi:hypothetical protein
MLSFPANVRVFVCREPVDLRKSFDGLMVLVGHVFQRDPLDGHLFLFLNRRRDRPRSEELPAHLERRTERIEPTLPADCRFQLCDCRLIGIDVVENQDCEPLQLFVHRIEYPKYKVPEHFQLAACEPVAEADSEVKPRSLTSPSRASPQRHPIPHAPSRADTILSTARRGEIKLRRRISTPDRCFCRREAQAPARAASLATGSASKPASEPSTPA